MVRGGDWITPHFAGTPRLDNPPLFLWLMALSFRAFGVTEYAAIFFSALSGVLCVFLVFRLAERLRLPPFECWAAAFVLLTTQYFLKYSRHAMFDVFLTLLFLLSIDAYVRAVQGERKRFLLLGLLAGLGVLTKSVLGLFPLAVAVVHLTSTGRARLLTSRWLVLGVGLGIAAAAPWYLASYRLHGDAFLAEHVRWLLWERAFAIGRERAGWASGLGYLRDLATTYWPWLPLAAWGIVVEARRLRRGDPPAGEGISISGDGAPTFRDAWTPRMTSLLLFFWLLVVIGTMSLANEKKLWYIMSAFPCLALLAAVGTGALVRGERARRRAVGAGFAALALGAVILNLTPVGIHRDRNPDLQRLALVVRATVPEGETVLNLDLPYWPVANQFLFYSDRPLTQPIGDPARVREGLDRGAFAILSANRYNEVAGGDPAAYPAVAASGRLVLVKAAPAVPAVLGLPP